MAGLSNTFDTTNVSGGFFVNGNHINGNVSFGGSYRDDPDSLHCLRLLKAVNPEDVRRRILTVKDKLVTASYSWILEDKTFRSWLEEDTHHLLWIKGGAGKGKTMMMAGLVDFLSKARESEGAIAVSYFFCQNSDSELRTVSSIVKGLIYMLAFREKSLVHHLKRRLEADEEGKVLTGPRALTALWHVLEDMLKDFHGARVYCIVDGLDECHDPEFEDFWSLLGGCNVTTPGKVKWLVTSRPLPRIEEIIDPDQDWCMINLEDEAQHVSRGVETFINEKIRHLRRKKHWNPQTVERVQSYLQKNAEGTFLWVALVCQRLQRLPEWGVENEITNFANIQRGLDPFYDRMLQVAREEIPQYADWCMKILRATTLVYRPLRLQELGTVVALPHRLQNADSSDFAALRDLIERCGSFILVHKDTIYFVHQSAKDYLTEGNNSRNFPLDRLQEHTLIAERCLDTLNSCLKDHQFPDPISLSKQKSGEDDLRLLSKIAYACSYWIHHTVESIAHEFVERLPNQGKICNLLDSHLIAWIHTLGSLGEVSACIRMIKSLLNIKRSEGRDWFDIMQDLYRFLRHNRQIIEESPNQAYASALLFAPTASLIRMRYHSHIPKWIKLRTRLNYTWDTCLETLRGHSEVVKHLAFSSDGSLLASKSDDCTRVWETETGKCRGLLTHNSYCGQLAFSPNDRVLASGSENGLELLDTTTGSQQCLPFGRTSLLSERLFAPNGHILAFGKGHSVILWDTSTGKSAGDFVSEGAPIKDMDFSHDSKRIAIAFGSVIKIIDLETLNVIATFRGINCETLESVQFSPDSSLVLSASCESIWLWAQATATLGKKLEGSLGRVRSAKFSPDGSLIVSVHDTETSVVLWETSTGNKLHGLPIPFQALCKLSEPIFPQDSKTMVTPLRKGAKIWDTATGQEIVTFEALKDKTEISANISKCSKGGNLFVQSIGSEVRIWEVATGDVLSTHGLSAPISALEFSPAGDLIASASWDNTVRIWSLDKSRNIYRNSIPGITEVIISLDGTLAVSISRNEDLRLWDLESGSRRMLPFKNRTEYPSFELISPDNSLCVLYCLIGVWIWEIESGSLLYRFQPPQDSSFITRVEFSLNGHLLKIEFSEDEPSDYDSDYHGTQLVEIHGRAFKHVRRPSHSESTRTENSTSSPDASIVAAISGSEILLRETTSGSLAGRLEYDQKRVSDITFLPDRNILIAGHEDGTIRSWDTNNYALLHTLRTEDRPPRFSLDAKRKFLWTGNRGFFLDEILQTRKKSALSVRHDWVLYNGEHVLWLPPEFRPTSGWTMAASSNSLVIGHDSGNLSGYLTYIHFDI